jgi:hypothetical protein
LQLDEQPDAGRNHLGSLFRPEDLKSGVKSQESRVRSACESKNYCWPQRKDFYSGF